METFFTIVFTALLIGFSVIPYVRRQRRKEREARARFEQLSITGLHKATTMHPHIDVTLCIGCGACVDACPEGDVLGVIEGKASLIHGAKCVGHALCAEACPVGGITMLMAPPGRSANLPVLSPTFETSVPGMYIAGELGGIGLIKNAVSQGIAVINRIAQSGRSTDGPLDVVIVGAGPAGLAAALAAKSHGLRFIMLEQQDVGGTILQYPRRKIVLTSPVDLPLVGRLNFREASKEELLDTWEEILRKTHLPVQTKEKVVDVRTANGIFEVISAKNSYHARHLVLALGRRGTPRRLGIPGEHLAKVMYRLIDAESYQDCDVLVVGGGDSAVEAAVGLALQGTNRVTLSYRKGEFSRIKERNARLIEGCIKKGSVNAVFNSEVEEILEYEAILKSPGGRQEIKNNVVLIFAGGDMPFEFLQRIGIQFHTVEVEGSPAA
jgi:thioredoxin reductase (NADPH)